MGGALDGQLETCATQHPRGDTCPSLVSQMALKEALRPSQHRRLGPTRRTCALARPAVGEARRQPRRASVRDEGGGTLARPALGSPSRQPLQVDAL